MQIEMNPQTKNLFTALKVAQALWLIITQRSLQSVLIFRLLLKITVERLRECVSTYFLSPQGAHEHNPIVQGPARRHEQRSTCWLLPMVHQPANKNSFQVFKTSPDIRVSLTWISHVVSSKRLGGDCVFAIALSALTIRWCSTCNRGRWGLNFLPTHDNKTLQKLYDFPQHGGLLNSVLVSHRWPTTVSFSQVKTSFFPETWAYSKSSIYPESKYDHGREFPIIGKK